MNFSQAAQGTPSYGDLVMQGGDLLLTSDASTSAAATNPILQDIVARLHTFAGSWFLDTSLGVPYYQQVFGLSTPPTLDSLLQNVILQTPGVQQLTDWNVSTDRNRRILSITFACTTDAGAVSYSTDVGDGSSEGNDQ